MQFNSQGLLQNIIKEQLTDKTALESERGEIDKTSIWVSKDGKRTRIMNMNNSHLLNSIRVLMGKSLIGTEWNGPPEYRRTLIDVMSTEAYRRGLELLNPDEGNNNQ